MFKPKPWVLIAVSLVALAACTSGPGNRQFVHPATHAPLSRADNEFANATQRALHRPLDDREGALAVFAGMTVCVTGPYLVGRLVSSPGTPSNHREVVATAAALATPGSAFCQAHTPVGPSPRFTPLPDPAAAPAESLTHATESTAPATPVAKQSTSDDS